MEGTVVCFYDKENNDSIMIRLLHNVNHNEIHNIKMEIKDRIAEAMDNGEYYAVDDKLIVKKALKKLCYDYEIIQVSDYTISF